MTLRRMKTYTGGQGYVYQYYFVGKRPAVGDLSTAATEYIFDVTSDRKTTYAVTVILPDQVSKDWAARHGRSLTEAEQYGAVKMRLYRAFDEIEDLKSSGRRLSVDGPTLEEVLSELGVD